jgi:hypothetical protein
LARKAADVAAGVPVVGTGAALGCCRGDGDAAAGVSATPRWLDGTRALDVAGIAGEAGIRAQAGTGARIFEPGMQVPDGVVVAGAAEAEACAVPAPPCGPPKRPRPDCSKRPDGSPD